ncbi:MAG: multidrug ABC transporter permease [Pseudonocardiales bacterium]|nr:ABC transporter permease [Pseudonocardiales bacterium]PZS27862.1 MAG: multidrug ABC transporter permease [Pseudonocardiales bacterium]
MLITQARTEFVLTLRNGEQVLLTLLIPLGILVGFTLLNVVPLPNPRVDNVTPRVLALAVMSTAFTGQAIALGFDRRYGVLKRLAATALPRWSLVAGRMLAVLGVVLVQLVVLGSVAAALKWHPRAAGLAPAVLLILAGTAAFGALGVLLGGALRAEVVLAVANMVWLLLVVAGGIVLSIHTLPGPLSTIAAALPSGALAEGLHAALVEGTTPWSALGVLLIWATGAGLLATRTLRLS